MSPQERILKGILDLKEDAKKAGITTTNEGREVEVRDSRRITMEHLASSGLTDLTLRHFYLGLSQSNKTSFARIIHHPAELEDPRGGAVHLEVSGAVFRDGVQITIYFNLAHDVTSFYCGLPTKLATDWQMLPFFDEYKDRPESEQVQDAWGALGLARIGFGLDR